MHTSSLKASGYCLYRYKGTHAVVNTYNALCVVRHSSESVLRRLEACFASIYYGVLYSKYVLTAQLSPIALLRVRQNYYDAQLRVVLIETFYGAH